VNLKFLPGADGGSFSVEPVFLKGVEAGSKNLARWTGLPVGSPLGHAASDTEVARITGPCVPIGRNRFELHLNRTWITSDPRHRQLWFAARNPGDGDYMPAVQQAVMTLEENRGGKSQVIDFPDPAPGGAIMDMKGIRLDAKSDAGFQVRYFVREGPARIDGGRLIPLPVPPRTKFPVAVTVVAWQWGDARINSAVPVERRILFHR
jgi:hypothetical protein